jgi:hypothetical protein
VSVSIRSRTLGRRRGRRLALVLLLAGGCADQAGDYYPLEAGRWWYYVVEETVLEESRERRYLVSNQGAAVLNGRAVQAQHTQVGSADYLARTDAGIVRLASRRPEAPGLLRDEPARTLLPARLDEATRWRVPSTLGLVESRTFERADRIIRRRVPIEIEKHVAARADRVEVPAGRFDACLRIDGEARVVVGTDRGNSRAEVEVRTSEWYAPGIGLVKLERREESQSSFLKNGYQRWRLAAFGG